MTYISEMLFDIHMRSIYLMDEVPVTFVGFIE